MTAEFPTGWTVVTLDPWRDNGAFTLTGIAPTAMGGVASFDRIELPRSLDAVGPAPRERMHKWASPASLESNGGLIRGCLLCLLDNSTPFTQNRTHRGGSQ